MISNCHRQYIRGSPRPVGVKAKPLFDVRLLQDYAVISAKHSDIGRLPWGAICAFHVNVKVADMRITAFTRENDGLRTVGYCIAIPNGPHPLKLGIPETPWWSSTLALARAARRRIAYAFVAVDVGDTGAASHSAAL